MKKALYYIDCITNLHVGSGDLNYNIVDKEVEKDPVTGNPTIHASGVKGALRSRAEKLLKEEDITEIFGKPCRSAETETGGSHRYFNAQLLCRPMRACGTAASVKVTTIDTLKSFVQTVNAFGFDPGITLEDLPNLKPADFGEAEFLVSDEGIKGVEGEGVKSIRGVKGLDGIVGKIKEILGGEFAIAKEFDGYDLPVIARNNLDPNNRNLWYEEYVPHGSRFYFIAISEDGEFKEIPAEEEFLQIGGNASIGYGYCKFIKSKEDKNEQA